MLTVTSLAVLSLLTVTFAAAGKASPVNACDLLTLTDVQGVLGAGFTAHPVSGATCAYSRGQGDHETDVVIGVSSIPPQVASDSTPWLKMQQANIKQRGGTVTVTPVSGLGEGAFYLLDAGKKPPVFQLHFGRGSREVVLDVETGREPNIGAAQTLGKIAYARLR
ncbi:MAG TPA: hypothetical protein VKW09_10880 [bacterium]|nr:hypothetical protein [bacterium]